MRHFRAPKSKASDIVIVDIDDESIVSLRDEVGWPWPRSLHAYLLQFLRAAGARVVGLDVLFVDDAPSMIKPERLSPILTKLDSIREGVMRGDAKAASEALDELRVRVADLEQDNDRVLAEEIAAAGNVFLAAVFHGNPFQLAASEQRRVERFALPSRPAGGRALTVCGPLFPVKVLAEAAAGVGHINMTPDTDGPIRRMPLLIRSGGRLYPSFPLCIAARLLGSSLGDVRWDGRGGLRIGRDVVVPTDRRGAMLLSYGREYRRVPYHKVVVSAILMSQGKAPIVDPDVFRSKIVLLGASAKGLADLRPTPMEPIVLGVSIHATAIDNILHGDFLRANQRWAVALAIFCVGTMLGIAVQRLRPVQGAALTMACLLTYALAAVAAFRVLNLYIDMVAPAAAMVFCYIALIVDHFTATERRHLIERQKIEHELKIAHEVQMSLLPDEDPVHERFDIAGWTQPCDDTGGDYYDFIQFEQGRLGVVIGDVSGHGLGPALLMAAARSFLRAILGSTTEASDVMTRLNALLTLDVGGEHFMTMFYGVLDLGSHELRYASAGHEPPLHLMRLSGEFQELLSTGLPLGVFEEADYPEGDRSELRKGDVLVLFTDCVFEAANENREQFGKERIRDLLIANAGLPARDIIECMHSAVLDFVGAAPINDDFTMIVIWCLEDPPKRGGDAASVEATDDEGRDAEAVDEVVFDEE